MTVTPPRSLAGWVCIRSADKVHGSLMLPGLRRLWNVTGTGRTAVASPQGVVHLCPTATAQRWRVALGMGPTRLAKLGQPSDLGLESELLSGLMIRGGEHD